MRSRPCERERERERGVIGRLRERCRVRTMKEREWCYKKNYIKNIIMMCKIIMREKMMWQIFMKSN